MAACCIARLVFIHVVEDNSTRNVSGGISVVGSTCRVRCRMAACGVARLVLARAVRDNSIRNIYWLDPGCWFDLVKLALDTPVVQICGWRQM